MIEGTEIGSAFNTMSFSSIQQDISGLVEQENLPPPKKLNEKKLPTQSQNIINHQQQDLPQQQILQTNFDNAIYNKNLEQEHKIAILVNELKKQKEKQKYEYSSDTYWDKLIYKRKELFKFIQSSFIILFAISLHLIIDHYIKYYVSKYDISPERELLIKLLYPVSVLFIAWNLLTFFTK